MKDFIAESEMRWYAYWNKESALLEQKWLTPDTHGIVRDLLRTELLAAYEKGRKDFGEEVLGKVEGMKLSAPPPNNVPFDWGVESPEEEAARRGYNKALSAVVSLIRESLTK